MRRLLICLSILSVSCSAGTPEPPGERADETFRQWSLPNKLREISGLALTSDERLLAITDEEAIVYEIDYETGGLVKAFAFGRPAARDDFEGITVLDDTVWLMTSGGVLYAAAEGANGERVAYERIDTGLGDECELEGLTTDHERGLLIMICKESRKKNKDPRIFEWSPARGDERIGEYELADKEITETIDVKEFNPSGITIARDSGNYLVVTARQNAVLELSREGELIDVIMILTERRHRQAEGIELTSDGRLLIADEGANGRARLAVYGLEQRGQD